MSDVLPLESGFPAIEDKYARILILGSMPSIKSLEQQQYYAHPRNAFWPIMSALFNLDSHDVYDKRCQFLIDNHLAVWDAIKACQRQGSLDQSIDATSMVANDFELFFQQHPHIEKIVFNGTKAEQVFNRHVLATLNDQQINIMRLRLPSTSPAHAAMTFEQKLAVWQHAIIG
ncbi:MAG: DNA-deoxyinosine glycosylase [Methylophaga sp.]|nr:DNA-deoxyinosine glycosylase [Methylophaga sp.]